MTDKQTKEQAEFQQYINGLCNAHELLVKLVTEYQNIGKKSHPKLSTKKTSKRRK